MRQKYPDLKKALSLIEAAKDEVNFTITLRLEEASANTIVRNIYESFRMLGQALLIIRGKEIPDHISHINELIKLRVASPRPLSLLDNFRRLRHNINYYAYKSSIEDAQDILNFSKLCFEPLFKEVKAIIEDSSKKSARPR